MCTSTKSTILFDTDILVYINKLKINKNDYFIVKSSKTLCYEIIILNHSSYINCDINWTTECFPVSYHIL